jgi:hypothetical protein
MLVSRPRPPVTGTQVQKKGCTLFGASYHMVANLVILVASVLVPEKRLCLLSGLLVPVVTDGH